jgi:hypothetical protein
METPTEAVVAETEAAPEVVAEEPATPSHKQTSVEPLERPVPTLDPNFWSNMLVTKREMDNAAKKVRYSNLVVFK